MAVRQLSPRLPNRRTLLRLGYIVATLLPLLLLLDTAFAAAPSATEGGGWSHREAWQEVGSGTAASVAEPNVQQLQQQQRSSSIPIVNGGEASSLGLGMGYVSPDQAQALVSSVLMTIVSEIGDKTFFIAAIMAMKHSRLLIFSAAISALAVMTVLSAMLGHLLPKLVPRSYVEMAAALLFLVFGAKMLLEGWAMDADHAQKEMDETSAELEEGHKAEEAYELEAGEFAIGAGGGSSEQVMGSASSHSPPSLQSRNHSQMGGFSGTAASPPSASFSSSTSTLVQSGSDYHKDEKKKSAHGSGPPPVGLVGHAYAMLQTVMSPVFLQTALIMFVAEWGDRSQLATIALAAAQDVFWVSVGTIFGHSICTGLAVVGGRFLATQISVRTVTLSGGLLFIIFGLIYGYEAFMTMSAV